MSNVKLNHYKNAYNRLYSFLRNKHPEILKEYQELMKIAKNKAAGIYDLSVGVKRKNE